MDGVCKQTQGYVKDKSKTIVFYEEEVGAPKNKEGLNVVATIESNNPINCKLSDIGKLYDDTTVLKICIEEGKEVTTKNVGNYLIKNGLSADKNGSVFGGVSNSIALKVKSNYIIRDKFNNEGKSP